MKQGHYVEIMIKKDTHDNRQLKNNFETNGAPYPISKKCVFTLITLEDILFFVTGCREIPPIGFEVEPSVEFQHS